MDYIVVYDKKKDGNPIVAIHSQRFSKSTVGLKDIHPMDDPDDRGVVVVPGEVISRMYIRKYKQDRSGKIAAVPVIQERTKELTSIMDTAQEQNILVFGETYKDIISITDLKKKSVEGSAVDRKKGIIGTGDRSGFFTVTCRVDTGIRQPEIISEKKNWKWKRDSEENIIGMELIDKAES